MSWQRKKSAGTAAPARQFQGAGRQEWSGLLPVVFVSAVFISLALRLFRLIARYAVNIFFSDQWDFNNATLFQTHSLWEMFRWQHGPERQGLGALVSYLIEPHFQWNSRTESFLVGALVVIVATCAIWLKKRLFGSLSLSDVCIPLIFFTPLQSGQIFVVANWSHGPLPLLLILLYCLSWTVSNVAWRYSLVLIINFVTIYTGFGLFLGLITPLALAVDYWLNVRHLQWGRVHFAGSLLVSLLSFASVFVQFVFASAVDCKPNVFQAPAMYAKFTFLMFANLVGAKGLGNFHAFIGAVLIGWMLWALAMNCGGLRISGSARSHRYLVAAILIVYPLVFSAIAAYGRSCLGYAEAQVSRYVMYLEPALLGLYLSLLTLPRGLLRLTALGALTATLAGTIPIRTQEQFGMEYYRQLKEGWKGCYLTYADISTCDKLTGHWIYSSSNDNALQERLNYLKRTKQNLYADQ